MVAVVSLKVLRAWSIAACSICCAIGSAAEPDACDQRAGACVAESEFESTSALQLSASSEATSMSTGNVSAPAPSSVASFVDRMEDSLPAPTPPQLSSVVSLLDRMEHSVPAPTPPSVVSLLDRMEHSVLAPTPPYWTSLISTEEELFGTPTPPPQKPISLVAVAERSSSVSVKVMTYNLEWWHLFGKLNGNSGSASELISENNAPAHFDILGFQECENIWRLFNGSGLTNFTLLPGSHAKCIAYHSSFWEEVGQGDKEITEDACPGWNRRRRVGSPNCWGARSLQWVRLENENGHVIFFANFHGPLPISSGGTAGGTSAAQAILDEITSQAGSQDQVILVGDFNSEPDSELCQALVKSSKLSRVYKGEKYGGVDQVFCSNCTAIGKNLGGGGSDHDALEATLTFWMSTTGVTDALDEDD